MGVVNNLEIFVLLLLCFDVFLRTTKYRLYRVAARLVWCQHPLFWRTALAMSHPQWKSSTCWGSNHCPCWGAVKSSSRTELLLIFNYQEQIYFFLKAYWLLIYWQSDVILAWLSRTKHQPLCICYQLQCSKLQTDHLMWESSPHFCLNPLTSLHVCRFFTFPF